MSDADASFISDPSTSQPSLLDPPSNGDSDEVDSLPSSEPDSDDSLTVSDLDESDAEKEWKESLQQLELLLTMVVVPYAGKYFGRKFAYWGWAKYMEWKYPVEVVYSDKSAFRATGAVEAAASL